MLEALWSVEFVSNVGGGGGGVVVFESSRVFGGDTFYFYLGRYELANGVLKGTVKVTHYFGPMNSIFGSFKELDIILEGKIAEPSFELQGHLVGRPDMKMRVRLTKRAALP